jgi:hypothetical protein
VMFVHITYNHGRGTTFYFVGKCIQTNIHLNGAIIIYSSICVESYIRPAGDVRSATEAGTSVECPVTCSLLAF